MSPPVDLHTTASRRQSALRFLYDRIDYERALAVPYQRDAFKLARMRELLARLGNPQDGLPIIHVAGTKGKGSTAAMTAAVLTAAGYRTGLFTSPHLDRVEERMAIDGRPCTPEGLADLVQRIAPVVEAMDREAASRSPVESGPTFFEITTAMALVHFAECKVLAAVLEVGLGGRLDSTNVCRPRVSVITSISFDHMKQLGNTLEAIAREKAGIIKRGVPVVSGVADPGPREVIRKACRRRGCRLVELDTDFEFEYHAPRGLDQGPSKGMIDFRYMGPGGPREWRGLELGLLGRHQGTNAAVAMAVLRVLQEDGWEIPEHAVRAGLAGLDWPARIEVIARRPTVIIDAAHNVASVDALVETLRESFAPCRRLLVFATTQDKDIPGMIARLLPEFDHVVLTQYLDNPRAVPVAELAAAAEALTGRRYPAFARPAEAWDEVRRLAAPDDLICVTGSFFIAAQMRHEVLTRPAS